MIPASSKHSSMGGGVRGKKLCPGWKTVDLGEDMGKPAHSGRRRGVKSRVADEVAVRQRLLKVAARRFVSGGYTAVTMEQIAADARVSKTTLYKAFGSKAALYAAVVQEAARRQAPELPAAPAGAADLREALTFFGRQIIAGITVPTSLELMRGVMAESTRFPELAEIYFRTGPHSDRKRFAGWVEQLGAAGYLRVDDPRVAADLFVGMIRDGAFTRAVFGLRVQGKEYQSTIAATVDVFLRLYGC